MNDEEKRIIDMIHSKLGPVENALKDNDGKLPFDMQKSFDLSSKNQQELQELIRIKTERGDKMYVGSKGFLMDEEIFAKMQEIETGFSPDMWHTPTEYLELQNKLSQDGDKSLSFEEVIMTIFMRTFGCYGQEKDFDFAESFTQQLLDGILSQKPEFNNNRQNDEYMGWLNAVGSLYILLGTVYTYINEIIKASYYFMQGLKTEMVELNTPYTDFIKHIFSKLNEMEKEEYNREGIGYIPESPIGSVDRIKRMLVSQNALQIIPDLVSDNGDVLICHNGSMGLYGHLMRTSSTGAEGISERIDIYETWLIDKDFNLKNIKFYWNGYFENFGGGKVLLPVGFRIKKQSKHLESFEFVKNKNADDEAVSKSAPL